MQDTRQTGGLLRSRRGYTLVELIVTFALLALFAVAMVYVVTSYLSIYSHLSSRATAREVSDIVLEKVTGEIAGAQYGARSGAESAYSLVVSDGTSGGDYYSYGAHECIALCNRTGSPLYITTTAAQSAAGAGDAGAGAGEGSYLVVHYRPINSESLMLEAVDWTYDPGVYQGFVITDLSFDIVTKGGFKTNVIRVSLTLYNAATDTTYTAADRYIECYNFTDSQTIQEKMLNGPIIKDGVQQ